jgi:hypothetical protein
MERNPVSTFESKPLTQEQKSLLFLASTVAGPVSWSAKGAGFAWKLWKIRQGLLVGSLLTDSTSTGGGGPGESPTSTNTRLLKRGRPLTLDKQGQPVPVVVPAASDSAHGGGRSGAKPRSRKRCPPGYRWNGKRCVRKG